MSVLSVCFGLTPLAVPSVCRRSNRQGAIDFARSYGERNCLKRLITGWRDKEQYDKLVADIAELYEQVIFAVEVHSNVGLQKLQTSLERARSLLKKASEYKVCGGLGLQRYRLASSRMLD